MEKFSAHVPENDEEKKPSMLGGIVKKALIGAAGAGVVFGAVKMNQQINEGEKYAQQHPRENLEHFRSDVQDISLIKANKNIGTSTKFYFRSTIHNEGGIKWVGLVDSDNHNFTAVTANSSIINFLEENPDDENAFLQKNEKGEVELARGNGEVVTVIE